MGIQVISELCQRVHREFGLQTEWDVRIVVPIFTGRLISGTAIAMEARSFFCMEHGCENGVRKNDLWGSRRCSETDTTVLNPVISPEVQGGQIRLNVVTVL